MLLSPPFSQERSTTFSVRPMPAVPVDRFAGPPSNDPRDPAPDSYWLLEARHVGRGDIPLVAAEPQTPACPVRRSLSSTVQPEDRSELRFSAMSVAVGVAFLFLCKPSAENPGQTWKLRA